MRRPIRTALNSAAVGAAAALAAIVVTRTMKSVRATDDERIRILPGDDLIANPLASVTNAVTIHADPNHVWPWLAQMGARRAGWYSYDALDNGGQPSAACIVPELQHLTVGMLFPALPGATDGFTLAAVAPSRSVILEWKTPDGVRLVSWAFVLERFGGGTRVIVRARVGEGYQFRGIPWRVSKHIVPVAHFIMQRKQLLGIARRVEFGGK